MKRNPYTLYVFHRSHSNEKVYCAGIRCSNKNGDFAHIQATETSVREEGIKNVNWANERHNKVKKLSISQGFEPVLI